MIATIIILSLAFTWLGYETDWMRIRLVVGIESLPPNWLLFDWSKWKRYMIPICGWEWIKCHHHPTPEYKIELIAPSSKYTIKSNCVPALRDAFRVYRNPYLKINLRKPTYWELSQGYNKLLKV